MFKFHGQRQDKHTIYQKSHFKENGMKKKDLTGRRYGKLIVIEETEPIYISNRRRRRWLCQCDCGNKKIISQDSLATGNTKSCGCGCEENRKKIMIHPGSTRCKYPYEKRLKSILMNMKCRCYNPNTKYFENYGGRGISICDEWLGEEGINNFIEWAYQNGYNETLTIDRIDNDKDYSPENCRWISRTEQMSNTRINRFFDYYGQKLTAPQIARLRGCDAQILRERLKAGWDMEKAIITPKKKYKTKEHN